MKKNQYSHQISLATVNNSFRQEYCNEEMVVRRQRFGGVSTRMVGGRAKRQKEITHTHTLIHTNMSETDVGCHARPPTVHNEGHSPFCSGSPTVNTILSHWASFPPPLCTLPSICLFFFHISFSPIQFGAKRRTERAEERKSERIYIYKKKKSESREQQLGADLQDSLETSVRPCLSLFLLPISSTGGSLCAQERLLYLGICGAPLGGWVEGGRVSEGAPQASAPL